MKKKKTLQVRAAQFAALALLRRHLVKRESCRQEKLPGEGKIRRQISARVPVPEKMLFRALGGKDKKLAAISRAAASQAAAKAGLSSTGSSSVSGPQRTGIGARLGRRVAKCAARELTRPLADRKKGLRRLLR